ncbi:MAG: hypothetical protein RLZZ414_1106 [Bacteroidota bacterium]|jgi:hypothetical protein
MYNSRPNLYIGFHGCDEKVRDQLVTSPNSAIKMSEKPFDWLGHGFYVWENNQERAFQWAKNKEKKREIEKASVVGVVYVLGNCLDFTDSQYIDVIENYYTNLKDELSQLGKSLPVNKDSEFDLFKDKLIRELDCMVIEYMHKAIKEEITKDIGEKGYSELKYFDSARSIFTEGGPAFEGAGIQKKNHIQICIRNQNCIKAFFIPRNETKFP